MSRRGLTRVIKSKCTIREMLCLLTVLEEVVVKFTDLVKRKNDET